MCTIIVDCSGFPLEHEVFVQTNTDEFKKVASLPTSEVAGYANAIGVNKILLNGELNYCLGIKQEISKNLIAEYANNNIEIEVIEK